MRRWSHEKVNQVFPPKCPNAVRMVQELRGECPSLWAAIESFSAKIGSVPQTQHEWVRGHEVDAGFRQSVTTVEHERVKALECENKELRRADEILKLASVFLPRRSSTADSIPERLHRPASRYPRSRADLQSAADRPSGYRRQAAWQRNPELRCVQKRPLSAAIGIYMLICSALRWRCSTCRGSVPTVAAPRLNCVPSSGIQSLKAVPREC